MRSTSFGNERSSLTSFKPTRFLTREEETDLARRYGETGDPALARRLVESHFQLVAKLARQCCSRRELLPDLIQEGCLGLMRAVEKYDPGRGIRLSSYAAWWIRAFIYQYLMTNTRMLRVATTFAQRKLYFHMDREIQRLERAGKPAQDEDIAQRLAVPERVVREMRARLAGREVHLETTVTVDADLQAQRLDGVSAPPRPDEEVEENDLRSRLAERVESVGATLGTRDRAIFEERLLAEDPVTLREIGLRFGVSRERARQLEASLKKRLRPLLREFGERFAPESATATT